VVAEQRDKNHGEKTLEELRLPAAAAKVAGISREDWLNLCEKAYDGGKV
jgi:hypothetical protein